MKALKWIVTNPYLNVVVGLIFLCSGVVETVRELEELEELKVGAHHGVILFALLQILKNLPDVFEGLEFIDTAGEEKAG